MITLVLSVNARVPCFWQLIVANVSAKGGVGLLSAVSFSWMMEAKSLMNETVTISEEGSPIPPRRGQSDPRAPIRTLRILELVAEEGGAMTLAEISHRLVIPKTSALSLLRPMMASGYLVQVGGRYSVGPMMYRLMLLSNRIPMAASLQPALEKLSRAVGESVSLCILDAAHREVEYAETYETDRAVRYVVRKGERRPLHGVSAGLVLLAYQSPEWVATYLETQQFERFTAATIAGPEQLLARLTQIRAEGYAIGAGEYHDDVYGFAAPVFSQPGKIVAALAIGAPASRAFASKERYVRCLREAAVELSVQFGHHPA